MDKIGATATPVAWSNPPMITAGANGKDGQMTRVFVSYNSEDNYFVDFLVELLRYHHIDVWVYRSNLNVGANYTAEIDQALASCDYLVAVISRHSSKSPWMTREISVFKAINPDRPVIPLLLDTEADVNRIYDGLGQVQGIRCYESLLEGFRQLLQLLDRVLFPVVERRITSNRRSRDRRQEADRRRGADRRTGRIFRRLKYAVWEEYKARTGRGEFYRLETASEIGRLARFLADPDSPLFLFDIIDRQTGQPVILDFQTIEATAHAVWESNVKEDLFGVIYTIDGIIIELIKAYDITPTDRRDRERRDRERRDRERRDRERRDRERRDRERRS